ncbi:MAG: hypothetical protein LBH77_01320 [Tannerella sp.]|jgi:hypothetical protein|nr:hypothetical protein [Tannerella sp.]
MIKANITNHYSSHINKCSYSDKSIFIADYTEQTKTSLTKKGVELFFQNPPTDIDVFSLINNANLNTGSIVFDNTSFVYSNGNPRSQCECVIFPTTANTDSWILFTELKYSNKDYNNGNNLRKAINQLYKTRTYYFQKGIFGITNTCYLLASLPMQAEPFANFSLPPAKMQSLKLKYNIVLRLKNSAEIIDDENILV